MRARIQAWAEALGDQFWLKPAIIVIICVGLALAAVWFEGFQSSRGQSDGTFGYTGGAEGARVLLGSVASSSIGVAGTIFSITIAALSLASAQMGPRLLRNFIRDSRNQVALGIFVGTFAYSLVVLRTVRTEAEGSFVPHIAVTGSIILALVCLATLVWFVHHVATSINVETVVDVVHRDLIQAIEKATLERADPKSDLINEGSSIALEGSGYLLAVDADGLADWAVETRRQIKLRARPGVFIPTGMPIALISPSHDAAAEVIKQNITLGAQPAALQDLEYYIGQLAEIAVRALSPGVNDPFTAASVLERFGDALCRIARRHLPTGAICREGRSVLSIPLIDYAELCSAMFNPIRQNAFGSAMVMGRLLNVLTKIAEVERMPDRLDELSRHADLALHAGTQGLHDSAGLEDLRLAKDVFVETVGKAPTRPR